jgi:glutamate dehydrogenase
MDGVDALVGELTRWYLRNGGGLDIAAQVERDQGGFAAVVQGLQEAGTEGWRSDHDRRLLELEEWDVPERAARFGAGAPALVYAPDVLAEVRTSGRSVAEVTRAFFAVGERMFLQQAEQRVQGLPAVTRWQRLANGALIDDLRLLRRQIVARVLADGKGLDVDEAVERYIEGRAESYARLASLMESIGPGAAEDSSLAMVMVHQIRQVVG